jgi:hypothetical protein
LWTFTRFCNTYLEAEWQIQPATLLVGALDDGFALWHLLKNITKEQLPKLNNPKSDIQKLNNLGICLDFLTEKQVKLIGIGPHGSRELVLF